MKAKEEIEERDFFDITIVNDDLVEAQIETLDHLKLIFPQCVRTPAT